MVKSKHYLILGFGVTGQSVLDFIIRQSYYDDNNLMITIFDQKFNTNNNLEQILGCKLAADLNAAIQNSHNIKLSFCNDLVRCKKFVHEIDVVIASPGINPKIFRPVLTENPDCKAAVISDIQLFIDNLNKSSGNILAITGTNGKSTVCELASYLLKNQKNDIAANNIKLGGNFGIPVLNLLDDDSINNQIAESSTTYVLELSSFQLALTHYLPSLVAVCLNISPDHLYWHGDMATYVADKLKIYQDSKFDIINLDQPIILEYYKDILIPQKIAAGKDFSLIFYSTENRVNHDDLFSMLGGESYNKILWLLTVSQGYICLNEQRLLAIDQLPDSLKSDHNISNLLSVIGMLLSLICHNNDHRTAVNKLLAKSPHPEQWFAQVDALKLFHDLQHELDQYLQSLIGFKGLPYRCQLVSNFNNIAVYNDSKATNLDACITAIKSVKKLSFGKIWLILGGVTKEDLDDAASRKLFRESFDQKIAGVVIFGKDQISKQKLFELLPPGVESVILNSIDSVAGLEEVVSTVYKRACPNDTILFSPAAASFDLFNNYMHRGALFTEAVLKYAQLD